MRNLLLVRIWAGVRKLGSTRGRASERPSDKVRYFSYIYDNLTEMSVTRGAALGLLIGWPGSRAVGSS